MHDHKPLAMESPADEWDVVKLEYFITAKMGDLPSTSTGRLIPFCFM